MYSKLFFFVLLGVASVLAHPGSEKVLRDRQADEVVLRSTVLKEVDEFLQVLFRVSDKLIGEARIQFQKLVNIFIEYRERAKKEVRELITKLQHNLRRAKKYNHKKYEEVKHQAASTLKKKEKKIQAELEKMQASIKNQVDSVLDNAPHIEVTAKVTVEEVKPSDPLVTPGPSKNT